VFVRIPAGFLTFASLQGLKLKHFGGYFIVSFDSFKLLSCSVWKHSVDVCGCKGACQIYASAHGIRRRLGDQKLCK
jgi:hypothetical protein